MIIGLLWAQAWVAPPRDTWGTYPTFLNGCTTRLGQIFHPSVFCNTEFLLPHVNVCSISHSTHQFHSNSASYNTFQWLLGCLRGSICTPNWGFCTPNKGYTQIFSSLLVLDGFFVPSPLNMWRHPWAQGAVFFDRIDFIHFVTRCHCFCRTAFTDFVPPCVMF